MEWTTCIREAIDYMEANLLEEIKAEDVANEVHMSSFYLQKGFRFMTGYSIGEYIRYRRLYLAAIDVIQEQEKIIDLAYKYGYDTPESFTKAFKRFHGVSPQQMHGDSRKIKTFLPLKIVVTIQGGNDMDYVVEKMAGFQVIGFEREFSYETAYQEIPKFWGEIFEKHIGPLFAKENPETELEKVICETKLGTYGVCIEDSKTEGMFRYLIAGTYHGGAVPEGLTLYQFPDLEWAKFRCVGPIPGAIQAVNTKIFQEWLPGNQEYEVATGANIEWYSPEAETTDPDYESAIWIPVKRK